MPQVLRFIEFAFFQLIFLSLIHILKRETVIIAALGILTLAGCNNNHRSQVRKFKQTAEKTNRSCPTRMNETLSLIHIYISLFFLHLSVIPRMCEELIHQQQNDTDTDTYPINGIGMTLSQHILQQETKDVYKRQGAAGSVAAGRFKLGSFNISATLVWKLGCPYLASFCSL